jgi:hypothetical protein
VIAAAMTPKRDDGGSQAPVTIAGGEVVDIEQAR